MTRTTRTTTTTKDDEDDDGDVDDDDQDGDDYDHDDDEDNDDGIMMHYVTTTNYGNTNVHVRVYNIYRRQIRTRLNHPFPIGCYTRSQEAC